MANEEPEMNTLTLEQRNTFSFDDLLATESSIFANLDSTYDRGMRAGQAGALRDHLAAIVAAAQSHIARRPADRNAVLSFVGSLQKLLIGEADVAAKDVKDPFEFGGGLGI